MMYRSDKELNTLIGQVFGGTPPHIRTRLRQMAESTAALKYDTPSWGDDDLEDIPDHLHCPIRGFMIAWKEWGESVVITDDYVKNKNTIRLATVEYKDNGLLKWELYERK